MELSNELDSSQAVWILWADGEILGYASTEEDIKDLMTANSNRLVTEIQEKNPTWKVTIQTVDDSHVKIKCINPGYIYNSKWTANRLNYQKVPALSSTPPIPPPLPENLVSEAIKEGTQTLKPKPAPPVIKPKRYNLRKKIKHRRKYAHHYR